VSRTRAGVDAILRLRTAVKILVVVALVAGVAGTGISEASSPPQGNVTVPTTVGQTVTDTWSGSIPALANASSNCGPFADTPVVDQHTVNLKVSTGLYDTLQANFTFNINWPADAGNDEILTVLDPTGGTVGSSDGGDPSETVRATNLKAGAYKVIACGFTSGPDPQPYNGSLTLQTVAFPPPPPPPGPRRGITFDHANLNDPRPDGRRAGHRESTTTTATT
jgi:hypothetical protein